MAVLSSDQVRRVFSDDGPRRWGLFALLNITTGDTIDMLAFNYYRKVNQSVFMGCTVAGTVTGSQAGATITVPAGLSGDSAYMLVAAFPHDKES